MTPDFPLDVEVAIVAHDNLTVLPAALESLAAAGCSPDSITVVDVASADGTVDWIAANWPAVRVRRLTRNEGPNPGRNLGIREAAKPFVLLMDADVVVDPHAVHALHAAMTANPSVKVGSPIVVHASRPDTIQYAGGAIHFICEAINPWMDRPLEARGAQPATIGAAPACGLLIDRVAALEVGLFDERYFMGKDDGDFIHRMRIAGHAILELPNAIVRHHSRPRGAGLFYYQVRNRWHFMLKNYQWRTLILILPCLLIHEPLQFALLVAKGHGRTYFKAIGGLIAMLPSLGRDRALINRIRTVNDGALLESGHLIIRDDLAGGALLRMGKGAYEGLLAGYWRLLRATVLRA